jgi:DNA-binding transcriptional ArsR family regulator
VTDQVGRFEGVDPLLVDPVRLFVVSLLCSTEWCRFGFVRDTVGLSKPAMSRHITRLRSEDYVTTTMGIYGRTWIKLTPLGLDRFASHVAALHGIVTKLSGQRTSPAARGVRRVRPRSAARSR